MRRVAILDDYQAVALEVADWSAVSAAAQIDVFQDHVADEDALVERLAPYDVLCVMRERTPLTASLIARLPTLKLIASTGSRNASIDLKAAEERGIAVTNTGYASDPTIEMSWALILGLARNLVDEANAVRGGGWQQGLGMELSGKTLGLLGCGRVGSGVARIGAAFGMSVIAWSQNLTPEAAAEAGATRVEKEALFAQADILSIHTVLSKRTRGIVDAAMIARMKPDARLINTSRGPIVEEAALVEALRAGRIAGAAIDVYDIEPLPAGHPFRTLPNVLATPHIGYVSREMYRIFYGDCARAIAAWLEANPA